MPELAQRKYYHSNEATWIMVAIAALLSLGALLVYSAGATVDRQFDYSKMWEYTTVRRIIFVPIALVLLAIAGRMNYRKFLIFPDRFWLSPVVFMLIISIIFLAMTLIPGLGGVEKNASSRWLNLFGIKFQPSELTKWTTVFFLSGWIVNQREKIRTFWQGFFPGFTILGLTSGLIGKEDFGTAALLATVGTVVLLAGGVKKRFLLLLIPVIAIGFYFGVYKEEYRWKRVMAHFSTEQVEHLDDTKYQGNQSVMAIGVGGMMGTGLGQGTVKLGWLPEDTTDFIFAIIAEELGFAGCCMVIALYLTLIWQGLRVVAISPDPIGKLLSLSATAMIGCQALINLMVVSGLAPTKGIALPFISAGGSGLVVTAMASGVLINIARQGPYALDELEYESEEA
ncbi:MAG: cell division protein FtsW [Sedimentisphaerales bacterium]|nr:cell division protein FtsW [Sedimentisphaerales bacterium]